jgi:TatA/E family protein of Tat protein translocase
VGIENPVHLLFIAAVALIVLGPKRLPGLARALGQGIREFRASLSEGESDADARAEREAAVEPHAPVAATAQVAPSTVSGAAGEDTLQPPDQGAASE